jgi:hypothetical protein
LETRRSRLLFAKFPVQVPFRLSAVVTGIVRGFLPAVRKCRDSTDSTYAVLIASVIRAMIESVSTSETSINIYQTSWCNIPEDSHPATAS